MRYIYTTAVAVLLAGIAWADTSITGPLPQEQKELIQFLAEHHQELKREVTITDNGYVAITTSKNPVLVEKLKAHFAYMEQRLGSGAMVRRWDPAFAELVAYYDQLDSAITQLDNGIKIVVSGRTPEAALVAQNHALIVTGFVSEGQDAVQDTHPGVIPAATD